MMSDLKYKSAEDEAHRQIDLGLVRGVVFAAAGYPPVALGLQSDLHGEPMTVASRFDIASVGKTFTAAACAHLYADGKLDPDAPFTEYLPEHILASEKNQISVRDLAMHVGGFDNSKPYQSPDMVTFHRGLFTKRPIGQRGSTFCYACSNFILLGKIVESITGERLDDFCRRVIWTPLGMNNTTWEPPGDDGRMVQSISPRAKIGEHDDDVCFFCPFPLGSGSAFSDIGDMMKFVADIARRERFPPEYYDLMSTCGWDDGRTRRSFGWDMSPSAIPMGLSERAITHSGWTGQTICADEKTGFYGVVLTARLGDHDAAQTARTRILELLV